MTKRKTAGELSLKAACDSTKYDVTVEPPPIRMSERHLKGVECAMKTLDDFHASGNSYIAKILEKRKNKDG